MPQVQLPLFPVGTTEINSDLAFERKGDQIVYFNGHLPVFTHGVEDLAAFRIFTTQLIVTSTASYGQIARAFGVPMRTLKRYTRRYRDSGLSAFIKPAARRVGHRLTPERLVEVQGFLDGGMDLTKVSQQTGMLVTTLRKAIQAGRLRDQKKSALSNLPPPRLPPRVNAAPAMR